MQDELTPADRARVLERLLVFKNGFMDEAAVPVCSDAELPPETVEAALVALVDEGTLTRREVPTGDTRYDWSEQYRELAGKPAHGEETRLAYERQARWFTGYLQELRPRLAEGDQGLWLDQIELDHESLHACLEAVLANPYPDLALDLCIACFRYWYMRGHFEVGSRLSLQAVSRVPMRQDSQKLRALNNAGLLLEVVGDLVRARVAFQKALGLARALGQPSAVGAALGNLATNLRDQGFFEEAKQNLEEAVNTLRGASDKARLLPALCNYAAIKIDTLDYSGVREVIAEGRTLAEENEDQWALAFFDYNHGQLLEGENSFEEAKRLYKVSLARYHQLKDAKGVAQLLKALAQLAVRASMFKRAATLFGAAEFARESHHIKIPPVEDNQAIVAMSDTKGALGDSAFQKAFAEGHSMRLEEAVVYASTAG